MEHSATTLIVRDLVSNTISEIHSTWIILADGKRALLPDRCAPTADFGVKGHFTDVDGPRDAVELFGVRGCYGGTAPIENAGWNLAFSIPQSRISRHGGDLDALFDELLHENVELNRRFARAKKIGPWLSSPLLRFAGKHTHEPGIIPIGNAAAAIEPIGGEGMGLAMRSAELAARAVIDAAHGNTAAITDLPGQFSKLWRTRRLGCRFIARALSQPAIASFSLDAAGHFPPLASLALHLIGKGD